MFVLSEMREALQSIMYKLKFSLIPNIYGKLVKIETGTFFG